jgi:hypothetical protein
MNLLPVSWHKKAHKNGDLNKKNYRVVILIIEWYKLRNSELQNEEL